MQHRDQLAEPLAEAADRLRRERNLGHEHDGVPAAFDRGRTRPQVHLGLAAPRLAVQEEVAASGCHRLLHSTQRSLLRRTERHRRRILAAQRVRLGRLAPLASPRP